MPAWITVPFLLAATLEARVLRVESHKNMPNPTHQEPRQQFVSSRKGGGIIITSNASSLSFLFLPYTFHQYWRRVSTDTWPFRSSWAPCWKRASYESRAIKICQILLISSREVGEFDDDKIDEHLTDRLDDRDDCDFPSIYDLDDDDERHCKINLTDRTSVVAWEDLNGQMQHTPDLRIDLHVDASEGQAIFALHGCVFLKGGKPNKLNLHLLIYPENTQFVEYNGSTAPPVPETERLPFNTFLCLRFNMTQPPSLVVPKDRALVPKARSEGLLNTMKALASIRDLTIYLNILQLVPETRCQLSMLPSVFLFNDLKTDERWADIDRLYHGIGGEVVRLGGFATAPSPCSNNDNNTVILETVEQRVEESSPPPYTGKSPLQSPVQLFTPSDRKRRRTSEPLPPSTTDKRILLAFNQVVKRNAELEMRIEQLEKAVQESAAHSPCRYDSEEVEHIINHIDDRIDDQLTGVHIELEDKVMEGTQQLVAEKTEETQEELWKELRQELMEEMRYEVKQELKQELKEELMAEIKMDLFKNMAQAMMSAACAGNEKARMSFGAGSQML